MALIPSCFLGLAHWNSCPGFFDEVGDCVVDCSIALAVFKVIYGVIEECCVLG